MNAARALNLKMTRARSAYWLGIFSLILVIGLTILGLYLFSPDWVKSSHSLQVVLLSPHRADYSVDAVDRVRQNPLSIALLGEVAQDQIRLAGQPTSNANAMPTLMAVLKSSVPTVTPNNLGAPTALQTSIAQPTQNGQPIRGTATLLPTITFTVVGPGTTPEAISSPSPTASPVASATLPTGITHTPASQQPSSTARAATARPTSPPQPTNPPATQAPTKAPTSVPTQVPTKAPTQVPTKAPTSAPTTPPQPTAYEPPAQPTSAPTAYP